jgi:hypothetical protein
MNMNKHINKDQIISYIHRTLSDAEREVLDKHLTTCQGCRARFSSHEVQQRRIENEFKAEINGVSPHMEMTFSQVAPRLHRASFIHLWPRLTSAIPLSTAIVGLSMAFYGVWQTLGSDFTLRAIPSPSGTFPALACFFMMFVSMDQFDRSFTIRPRFIISAILSFILWLGTFFIGLLNIIVIRDLTIAAYISTGGSPEGASVVTILTVLIAAMVYIGVVIGGAEYHYKHIGQPSSWKLFSWTIVIQLLIMVLPYLVL